jgi:hypothetical protein
MRAILLAVLLTVGATLPSLAADRKVQEFYGAYLGHGGDEPGEAKAAAGTKQTRFSQVIIRSAAEEKGGFTVEWATLKLKGDEIPSEADTKSYTQTFRPTDKPNIYRDVTSGDLNLGADTSWATIKDNTLSIVQISSDGAGGYFVTQYDRTLTPKGLDVHFTRIENSKIVRSIKLNLLKGPAKVN